MKTVAWFLWPTVILMMLGAFAGSVVSAAQSPDGWRIFFLVLAAFWARELKDFLFNLPPPWKVKDR